MQEIIVGSDDASSEFTMVTSNEIQFSSSMRCDMQLDYFPYRLNNLSKEISCISLLSMQRSALDPIPWTIILYYQIKLYELELFYNDWKTQTNPTSTSCSFLICHEDTIPPYKSQILNRQIYFFVSLWRQFNFQHSHRSIKYKYTYCNIRTLKDAGIIHICFCSL